MKWLKRIALGLVAVFVVIQLIRPAKTNPPVTGEIDAPPEVAALLRRACYDCHSNETKWPWYAQVAPASFLLISHVNDGRKHLNFSEWKGYEAGKQLKRMKDLVEEVESGDMPMPPYVLLHAEAKLTEAEKATLLAWAKGPAPAAPAAPAEPATP